MFIGHTIILLMQCAELITDSSDISLHGTAVLRSCSGIAMLFLKHAYVKLSLIVTDVQIVLLLFKYIHFEL